MVQFGGTSRDEVDKAAQHMLDALHETEHDPTVDFFDDPDGRTSYGRSARRASARPLIPAQPDTFEGWEDSAVAPDRLGDYLRDLQRLYDKFGYSNDLMPSLYGHFGQGCVHTRIPFDLYSSEGVATYRRFMESAAGPCRLPRRVAVRRARRRPVTRRTAGPDVRRAAGRRLR